MPQDLLPGKLPVRRWTSGESGGWLFREIGYGTYGIYGWYVWRAGRRWDDCMTVTDEREACELVQTWMAKATGWVEVPAEEVDRISVNGV